MKKEDILEEYFLEEAEKTNEVKGWKVIGKIEGCNNTLAPTDTTLELKTGSNGWICDFRIKLLTCGLVLCSPEYIINEDDLVLEAMNEIWKVFSTSDYMASLLENLLDGKEIKEKPIKITPYISSNIHSFGGVQTTMTNPIIYTGSSLANTALGPDSYTYTTASATCDSNAFANYINSATIS